MKTLTKNNNWILGLQLLTGAILLTAVVIYCNAHWDFIVNSFNG